LFDALDPRGYCGGRYETAALLGRTLADEVVRVLGASSPSAHLRIGARRRELRLLPCFARLSIAEAIAELDKNAAIIASYLGEEFQDRFPINHLWSAASKLVIERNMHEPDMRRLMIACCYYRALRQRLTTVGSAPPVDVPVQVLRVNEFTFLALPGEVLVESGEEWSTMVGTNTAFIISLANSHHRYLPGACHFAEPNARNRYETASAGLEDGAMDRAYAAARTMVEELHS